MRGRIDRPSLGDASKVQVDPFGQFQHTSIQADLAPLPAGLCGMQRAAGPGQHLVEVAIVAGGHQGVVNRRIEEAFGRRGCLQRQGRHLCERGGDAGMQSGPGVDPR